MTDRNFNREDITHTGWLKKQGGPFKTWQRRYFVLQGEYLHYFLREDDSRPLGTIPLRNNRVEKRPQNLDEPGKYLFEILPGIDGPGKITSSHETFLLWASSLQDADDWVQVVRRAIYKQKGGGIFGQSLLDTITNESTTSTKQIPSIVEQCVEQLKDRGLQEEGIFRLPGRVSTIKDLQERFDRGEKPDFRAMNTDIHTIASLLKLYLRLLPEPLIPWQHYQSFYNGIKLHRENEEEGKKELIQQLALLPRTNYNLLKYLCEFLLDVQSYESYNRMGMLNLATVFGPNIFRPPLENATSLMETTSMSQKFLHLLIRQHGEMFPPNDQIDFQTKRPASQGPTPPPRRIGRSTTSSPESLDLLKELKDKESTTPIAGLREKNDGLNHDSLLIDLEPADDWIKITADAAFSKRSYSVDGAFGFRDDTSLSDSSTLESSSEHLSGNSEPDSKNSSHIDLDATITPTSPTTLRLNNQEVLSGLDPSLMSPLLPNSNQQHTSPKRSSTSMGVDLTAGTPESVTPSNVSPSYMKEIGALKLEMRARQEEHEQKLVKWKIKCEGLQIQLTNEESAKKATEERNKQLLKQLNAFIAEYGPK